MITTNNQQQNAISLAREASLVGKDSSYEPCQTPTLSAKSSEKMESNLNSMCYPMFYPTLKPMLISNNYSMFYPAQKNKNRINLNRQEGICLTDPFHLDRASLLIRCARLGEQGVLGPRSAGIWFERVVFISSKQQSRRDRLVLSAADQLQISSFPGWGISSLEPCQTPTRLELVRWHGSATERNFISPCGFPGWKSLKL